MSNFKLMITNDGTHPASKWADVTVDELIEITEQAPKALIHEGKVLRNALTALLTKHHQAMIDHEHAQIKQGKHDLDLPYETESYTEEVIKDIQQLAEGTNFVAHFHQDHVVKYITEVLNRYFKTAKRVERQHFLSQKMQSNAAKTKKK